MAVGCNKEKVVFIMGSTGSGKTKLSIELGSLFPSEIINADKIQVYKGLDIITNKIPESERRGIPHHLLGIIEDPEFDFTVNISATMSSLQWSISFNKETSPSSLEAQTLT